MRRGPLSVLSNAVTRLPPPSRVSVELQRAVGAHKYTIKNPLIPQPGSSSRVSEDGNTLARRARISALRFGRLSCAVRQQQRGPSAVGLPNTRFFDFRKASRPTRTSISSNIQMGGLQCDPIPPETTQGFSEPIQCNHVQRHWRPRKARSPSPGASPA